MASEALVEVPPRTESKSARLLLRSTPGGRAMLGVSNFLLPAIPWVFGLENSEADWRLELAHAIDEQTRTRRPFNQLLSEGGSMRSSECRYCGVESAAGLVLES